MSLLENLPTVEEMMAALSSPVVPSEAAASEESQAVSMDLSTDDMVKMIFEKIMSPPAVS